MKRTNDVALIYYTKRSNGKLEEYSKFFIEKMQPFFSALYLVGNYEIIYPATMAISNKNISHPLQAYYFVMKELGQENISKYSKVICVSDDLMGPLFDLSDMFHKMEQEESDCWGITKQHKTPMNYLDYTGENLQEEYLHPDFLVIKNSLLVSSDLHLIFENVLEVEDERDSWVDNKALKFSQSLRNYGFRISTYLNTDDISKIYYNPLLLCPRKLIEKYNCPIFSRKSFGGNYINIVSNTIGDAATELMNFLEESKQYDIDLIWDTILKSENQQDIYNNLHLNYLLDSNKSDWEKTKNILKTKKIALIMHLYFMDLLDISLHYAKAFPTEGDIYITTNTEEKRKSIQSFFQNLQCNKLEIRVIENRGRDVSALLTGVKDVVMSYDYVCFVHDKKSAQLIPGSIGQEFGIQCFENTIGTKDFVNNVICTLHDNKRLGMLSPIYPIHGSYFAIHGNIDWAGNYENTKRLAEKIKITVPIEKEKSPVAPLGTMFWFKPQALKHLYACDWEYEDFPEEPNGVDGTLLHAIERTYSYSVQQAGYYPAMLSNEKFADITMTNLAVFLQKINRSLEIYYPYFSFQQLINVIDSMIYEIGLLKNQNILLYSEREKLEKQVADLYPKTSLKWQLQDRIKHLFASKREEQNDNL